MNHESGFLRAILTEPADVGLRLIYADWLEERGDPRGEFIRVQCELSKLDGTSSAWKGLVERERQLLARHETTWVGPLCGLADTWRFSDGFVEEVSLTGRAFVANASALFDAAPIRKVRLKRIHQLADQRDRLRLRDSGPDEEDDPSGGEDDEPTFAQIGQLSDSGVKTLAAFPSLSRLASLDLSRHNRIGTSGAQALAASPYLSRLEELDLDWNRIGTEGLRALVTSPHLPALAKLYLSRSDLPFEAVQVLADSPLANRLTALDLGSLAIEPDDVNTERAADLPPSLARLSGSYWNGQLGDRGIQGLVDSGNLAGLSVLDLSHNGIGPLGAKALASCPGLSGLTRLYLEGNYLGPEGARAVADSPYLTRLTKLDLSVDNAIGDEGAQAILASPFLRNLNEFWLDEHAGDFNHQGEIANALKKRFGDRLGFFT